MRKAVIFVNSNRWGLPNPFESAESIDDDGKDVEIYGQIWAREFPEDIVMLVED